MKDQAQTTDSPVLTNTDPEEKKAFSERSNKSCLIYSLTLMSLT